MKARMLGGLAGTLSAMLLLHGFAAAAAAPSGTRSGDDALTCEQIQAQGMAEAQRDQEERSRQSAEMGAQQKATMGLATAAMLAGGLGGTAQAAQKAAEANADRSVAMLGTTPQINPRLERLKELSAHKHCTARAVDGPGVNAGDDAMSCEQIAAELSPYAQQVQPNLQPLAQSQQQLYKQEREMGQKRKLESQAQGLMWAGASLDPTGMAKRAAQAATIGMQVQQNRESDSLANSPQFKQANVQGEQLAAQGARLEGDARLQHLLQLGQQKGCDKNSATSSR